MRTFHRVAFLPVLLAVAATPGFAKHKSKNAKPPACPACHMALSTTKTDANPREVKIGKKTFYCCAGCDMSKMGKGKKEKKEKK